MNKQDMNVIIICDYANTVGGAEKVAIESAIGLSKLGVNVIFFSAVAPIDNRLIEAGVRVICLAQQDVKSKNKLNALFQILWNRTAQKEFKKLLSELNPNNTVIHAHIWQKALSSSIFYEAYKKKFKITFTMHHYFLACPNGGFYNYQSNKICPFKPLGTQCIRTQCDKQNYIIKLFRTLRSLIERKLAKLPQQIKYYITISDLGEQVIKPYLPEDAKFYRIDNPFHISTKKKSDVVNNNKYIYIGRLSAEKGVVYLAHLVRDLGIDLIVIGDGPEKEKMEKITNKITFTGWISSDEIESYLLEARAFIFPTLWYEGMPMSVLECSAYGVPTILPDTCSAVEVVKNNVTGFVYKQGDYESLKRSVEKSLDNKVLGPISDNIYSYFMSKDYSTLRHCHQLIDLYNEMLGES